MNVNTEADTLTSNSNIGDYSLFYRGGISYCVGIAISAMILQTKYTGKNGIGKMDSTMFFVNRANTPFACCSSAVILPSVFILHHSYWSWHKLHLWKLAKTRQGMDGRK